MKLCRYVYFNDRIEKTVHEARECAKTYKIEGFRNKLVSKESVEHELIRLNEDYNPEVWLFEENDDKVKKLYQKRIAHQIKECQERISLLEHDIKRLEEYSQSILHFKVRGGE